MRADRFALLYQILLAAFALPLAGGPPPAKAQDLPIESCPIAESAEEKALRLRENGTTESERAFARELQRAFRENDRAWLLDHLDYAQFHENGVMLNINHKISDITTRREAAALFEKDFDAIFPPELRAAVMNDDLLHLRSIFKDLAWVGCGTPHRAWITFYSFCIDTTCSKRGYRINNIQYDDDPPSTGGK